MSKLEKIVDSVKHLHKKVLIPTQKIIKINQQETFGFYIPSVQRHVSLGDFYEYMTQGIWGGKLQNRLLVENGNKTESEDRKSIYSLVKPDLIQENTKQIGESKAIRSGQSVNLIDTQLNRYRLLQSLDKNAHIYFAIYRHSFPKIMSFRGSVDSLFEQLSNVTHHSIVLPFSLILELNQSPNEKLVYRYDGERFYACSCLRSPTINRLLTEPEEVLKDLGMNIGNFLIKRYLSPESFSIGRNKIKQFPILRIFDKDHSKWVKNFKFDINKADEFLQEDYKEFELFRSYDPMQDGCSDVKEIEERESEEIFEDDEIPF